MCNSPRNILLALALVPVASACDLDADLPLDHGDCDDDDDDNSVDNDDDDDDDDGPVAAEPLECDDPTLALLADGLGLDPTVCAAMLAGSDAATPHPSPELEPQAGAGDHTETRGIATAVVTLDEAALGSPLLQCGEHELGFTACFDEQSALAEGDYILVVNALHGTLADANPDREYVYAFPFDADGIAETGWPYDPDFPDDWYQSTDRIYELYHLPERGWFPWVYDATEGYPVKFEGSQARFIAADDTLSLLVPRSELAAEDPSFRVTSICHEGDWGYDGGAWTGDIEPGPDLALKTGWTHTCTLDCWDTTKHAWVVKTTVGRNKDHSAVCKPAEVTCNAGRSAACTNAADALDDTVQYSMCTSNAYSACTQTCAYED